MSDLAALFPNLPADIIREFDSGGSGGDGPLAMNGETSVVTDADIEAYLRQSGSLRAPLRPVLEGQQTPATPEFVNNGRPAPPANSATVEPPDYGTAPPESAPQEPATVEPPETEPVPAPPVTDPEVPPSPPVQPQWPSPQTIEEIPPQPESPTASRQQGIEALATLFESDPQLRSIVASYLTTGRAPQQQAVQPPPAAAPIHVPSVTIPPAFDEYTDPAIRAVWEQNQALNSRLSAMEQVRSQEAENAQRQYLQNASTIVESVASDFATRYAIPPNVMKDIRGVASRLGVANTYMAGVHPTTGLPVVPDVAEAAREAFRVAYTASPLAQQLESERTIARAKADATHKQKLAGVGGSSASVPRQPPTPQTPEGRRDAMNREVAEMFNGTWTGSN